ncbi:MAG: 5-formyltetrahydrofolate cyclo-ligase [Acetobacter sp.]|nr:5-formyltetrahydrofolate cyclo-ligase [Bacteroides sp.]MCM1340509.1 5-formyltetrahydrofolate cyclo-ligase [Acetobacter sp.]MCM1433249.1 5-formyltetrahydrofolate cyclo-ligase [Clostridiales bacterium]
MSVKSDLRKKLISKRKNIKSKTEKDNNICNNLLNSKIYIECKQILIFASLSDEINTDFLIKQSLNEQKKVALPKCLDSNGNMEFFYIDSISDLKCGAFNVREPVPDNSTLVTDFSCALCVVPALSYDKNGFRIGYGKGYYDRFLEKFSSISVGLCYNELISDEIPADKYDLPVDYIVTEDGIICCQ